jgi:hypothetical protein
MPADSHKVSNKEVIGTPAPLKQLLATQYEHIQKSHDYVKAARDRSK